MTPNLDEEVTATGLLRSIRWPATNEDPPPVAEQVASYGVAAAGTAARPRASAVAQATALSFFIMGTA